MSLGQAHSFTLIRLLLRASLTWVKRLGSIGFRAVVLCLARVTSLDVSTGRRELRNVLYRSDCSVKEKESTFSLCQRVCKGRFD
jgi:hypothetical protein